MQPYYGTSTEMFCSQQQQQQNQSMPQSNDGSANNMQYWHQATTPQHQQQHQQQLTDQHSPNHLSYGNGSYSSNTEPIYQTFQSTGTNIYPAGSHTNFTNGAHIQNGNSLSSQDLYQYSPYSGDLLQPEDIFQMDQPIRSANGTSLNDLSSSSSPPATLLDLGSGTIEPKQLSSYSDISESYYSLHDDNSTTSSHNTDTNCYYTNIGDQIHLSNGSLNNAVMPVVSASSTSPFESTPYYCDTRNDTMLRPYEKHLSPIEAACEYTNSTASYPNNNNNNNSPTHSNNNDINAINNNNHGNFKSHKRKASEAFAGSNNFLNAFDANAVVSHEYYGNSVDHLSNNLTNLELQQQQNHSFSSHYGNNCSPIISEYCNEAVSSHPHSNPCMTYYDNETNHLIQLSTNSYEISVVGSN